MSIVVTGASGQLGRLVAEELLERSPSADLVLVTRRPESLADLAERGADVRSGDFDRPETLAAAFDGAERVLMISTGMDAVGRRFAQHRTAIEAAVAADARHVVYTSLTNPVSGHPWSSVADEHRGTEELLQQCGLPWTILRNGIYSEVLVPPGSLAVAYGKLYTNAGAGLIVPVSRRDCAAAAASVLTTDGHESATYDVAGPAAVSQAELAALLGEVSGRSIEVNQVNDKMLSWSLTRTGMPKRMAREIVAYGKAIRDGYYHVSESAVEQITGQPPRPLHEVLIAHRGELLAAAA